MDNEEVVNEGEQEDTGFKISFGFILICMIVIVVILIAVSMFFLLNPDYSNKDELSSIDTENTEESSGILVGQENLSDQESVEEEGGKSNVIPNITEESNNFTEEPINTSDINNSTSNTSSTPEPKEPTSQIIENDYYILYMPSSIDLDDLEKKYPLVLALSPSADANSMINKLDFIADKHDWIIMASKESRNGMSFNDINPILKSRVDEVTGEYPIDESKIIATGFSGGAMTSHAMSFDYPNTISAVVANTGKISDYYLIDINRKANYPTNKIAVFLASPTDFRYGEMKNNSDFLEEKNWNTKWIEFEGGHTLAPDSNYEEAAEWLQEQL